MLRALKLLAYAGVDHLLGRIDGEYWVADCPYCDCTHEGRGPAECQLRSSLHVSFAEDDAHPDAVDLRQLDLQLVAGETRYPIADDDRLVDSRGEVAAKRGEGR
jgi:hypothetical protein